MTDFTDLVNLAARRLGAGVVAASDESFAEKENLLRPEPPVFDPHAYGPKGKVMDGWETRRRREPGHDWAIVRLGAPGVVSGVVVDTSYFTGNYPEECSVEGLAVEGYPPPTALVEHEGWVELLPRSLLKGDAENRFGVPGRERLTHVRLRTYPDGGVARLRVYGEVIPDPRWLSGAPFDVAAQENGGLAVGCSDRFYSSPHNLNAPGFPAHMGEGWETRRRRGPGNDWVTLRLAAPSMIRQVEVDTTYFLHNAPGWCQLRGCDATSGDLEDDSSWFDLLSRTPTQPDTRHRFVLDSRRRATHVRLDVFPDGGLARLRVYGRPDERGWEQLVLSWWNAMPESHAAAVLRAHGVDDEPAQELVRGRPVHTLAELHSSLARLPERAGRSAVISLGRLLGERA